MAGKQDNVIAFKKKEMVVGPSPSATLLSLVSATWSNGDGERVISYVGSSLTKMFENDPDSYDINDLVHLMWRYSAAHNEINRRCSTIWDRRSSAIAFESKRMRSFGDEIDIRASSPNGDLIHPTFSISVKTSTEGIDDLKKQAAEMKTLGLISIPYVSYLGKADPKTTIHPVLINQLLKELRLDFLRKDVAVLKAPIVS